MSSNTTPSRPRAERVIPGGVNSGNRRLPWPLAVVSAQGAHFTAADGTQFLDYHAAFGPLIRGHNHPRVNAAVHAVTGRNTIVKFQGTYIPLGRLGQMHEVATAYAFLASDDASFISGARLLVDGGHMAQ